MTKRRKNGRTVVASPLARRTDIEPAPLGRSFGWAASILDLVADRHRAELHHRREPTEATRESLAAARQRLHHALHYQRTTKSRRTEVGALLRALACDGGAVVATYVEAHGDYRADLHRAVLAWAETIDRRRVDDPATIELLARAHLEAGVSAALRRRVLRLPIDHPEAAAFREEARRAGNASRLDMIAGLSLASAANDARPGETPIERLMRGEDVQLPAPKTTTPTPGARGGTNHG